MIAGAAIWLFSCVLSPMYVYSSVCSPPSEHMAAKSRPPRGFDSMRLMLVAALLGAATGVPIGSKRQQAEQRLKSLVSRMLQDEEPRTADLHEGRMPGAEEDDKDLGAGVCPSYVSVNGNAGGRLQVNDEYCDKNCRMGFCPPDKCRCSTDRDTSTHGLIGTPDDACPKYVTLEEDGGKSKFNQVDDDWCDSNCRGNFLSCPKDKCRCFTDTQALALTLTLAIA